MIQKQSEEDIKTNIALAFFPKSQYVITKNRLDFCVADKRGNILFWAESKKGGGVSKWNMLAQLILTIKPRLDGGEIPPAVIGCFDEKEITFVEFYAVQEILNATDFNWNEKPSSVSQRTAEKVRKIISGRERAFCWKEEKAAVKQFIRDNFKPAGDTGSLFSFVHITKNNFVQIYNKWAKSVLPEIAVPADFYKSGLIDGDFFLADLLSDNNKTISRKLKVLLNHGEYEVNIKEDNFNKIYFKDGGKAHKNFWIMYNRPPAKEYQEYIRTRRDLLVPSGVRERKGAFFTPQIWVEKSQEYLAEVFGENWQDEYYIWDCCAGTGNLEEGLANPERVWASTLDEADVRVMKENRRLLKSHIFQFDFLNDDFGKLPTELNKIIKDEPEKLIIYINPPYGECGHEKEGKNKEGIASENKIYKRFEYLGRALRDIATLFIARIKSDIPRCKLAVFNKLKYITAPNFTRFRSFFTAVYKNGFVVIANTFDNVKGNFPIGFLIWDFAETQKIKFISCNVLNNKGIKTGNKKFFVYNNDEKLINDWLDEKYSNEKSVGYLNCKANDFQHNQNVCLLSTLEQTSSGDKPFKITKENVMESAVYLTARHCIAADWLNDRDQFLYPNDGWEKDTEFQNDCLAFTLFHSQNRIMSNDGVNNWIPFSPGEVNARDDFSSNFMADFIKGRKFSKESQEVLNAGRVLWKFYHAAISESYGASVDASLYEIREYFRGRTEAGRLKPRSDNAEFQALDDTLKETLTALASKIAVKIYKYQFLRQ